MKKIKRRIQTQVTKALHVFPAVFIAGPRQSGKTTLTQQIIQHHPSAKYITFDDMQMRSAATYDPDAFLKNLTGWVVLDEIQMVPALFRPLKIIIDEDRKQKQNERRQFLLTGSASIMALPTLSDALVGRMSIHTLLPFSMHEVWEDEKTTFVDRAFTCHWRLEKYTFKNKQDAMFRSTFPELSTLSDRSLRYTWCNSYLSTILQRDIRALMEIEKIAAIPDLLRLLAARSGGLLNEAALSRDSHLNHITAKRYRRLLENLFLILSVPAWSKNIGKRLVKSPKIYINDLNLLAYLLNMDSQDFSHLTTIQMGSFVENFVAVELNKQTTFSQTHAVLYHYRSASGQEVDFILEGPQQRVVGIEVKSKSKVDVHDFKHLIALQTELKEKWIAGYVLYMGSEIVPFGNQLWAIPIAAL